MLWHWGLQIPGYVVAARRDRNRHGGCVLCYVSEGLQSKHRLDPDPQDLECTWIEIKTSRQQKLLVGTLYRPSGTPTQQFYDIFDANLAQMFAGGGEVYFLGDINSNLLLDREDQIISIASDCRLAQLINGLTRVTSSTVTLIDLIFAMDESKVVDRALIPVAITDHESLWNGWGIFLLEISVKS